MRYGECMEGVQLEQGKVVFFDGGCLLCSSVVKWTHERDRLGQMWFASLDSRFAANYREELSLPSAGEGAETFGYWDRERGRVSFRSNGALALFHDLGGVWAGLAVLGRIVPCRVRDVIYNWIAKNRRHWFGSSESCVLPPASLQGRVLE